MTESRGFLIPPIVYAFSSSLCFVTWSSKCGPIGTRAASHLLGFRWLPSRFLIIRRRSTFPIASAKAWFSAGGHSPKAYALSLYPPTVLHLWTKDSCDAVYFSPLGLVHSLGGWLHLLRLISSKGTESVWMRVGLVVSAPNLH